MVSVMTAALLSYFQAATIVLIVSFYAFVCMFMVYFSHQTRARKGFSCCHSLLYMQSSCRPKYGRHIYATLFFTCELMCTNVSPVLQSGQTELGKVRAGAATTRPLN